MILGVLCLSLLVLVVDNGILNLAIPSLMRELGASPADIQWIINAYILVFAGVLLTVGALSDRYGRRRFLVIGLALFGGASLLATFAQTPAQLIACRAFMGFGGSFLMPSTLSIIMNVFDQSEQRKAIAAWSSVLMVGGIAGPSLGGFLLDHYWWGSVFLVNVPISVLAIAAALLLMPESRGQARPVDLVGAGLSTVGMVALVWAIISIPERGWTAPPVLVAVLLAVVLLTAFAVWERRNPHAMLPLELWRERNFSGASISIVLLAFSAGGLLLMLTQYLQFVLGYGVLQASLALIPYMVAAIVFNGLGATLGKKLSNRAMVALGMLVLAAGFVILTRMTPDSGYGLFLLGMMVMGVGGGLCGPAAYASLMSAVPPERAGIGSALNDTVQQTGGALSIALLGSVLSGAYSSGLPDGVPEEARKSIASALALGDPGLARTAKVAFVDAMSSGMIVGAVGAVAAAIVAWTVLRPIATPAPADLPAEPQAETRDQVKS
ncbi:MFS transporter [Streptosporangium carneum]|uniref:MFS transporter n=1 Tax=Streptosporangium carneum TaxID=47481 RepID=A0A9W6I9J8_9ACTN|nr:MFS transporter [Streptosporangium carneum]